MNEVERVREQALLTYEEIEEVRARLEEEYEDEEMTDVEWEEFVWGKIAHAQLDKVLKTEGIAVLDDVRSNDYYLLLISFLLSLR